MNELTIALRNLAVVILLVMGISGVLAAILFFVAVRKMRSIHVPPGAGFAETLLYTPFVVVLFIDLLDLALDILSAPFSWLILDRLGLKGLRGVAAVEALLPFTQVIPTMSLSWIAVRVLGRDRILEYEHRYDQYLDDSYYLESGE